jgi:S1-C subfamily serine protease
MVPANALQRTFRISTGSQSGTCFTVDVDGRQYIVTAKHVIAGLADPLPIRVHYAQRWHELQCRLVGVTSDEIDIAVLAHTKTISPQLELTPTTSDMYLSQDVYFLGFPYGWHAEVGALNNDFPLPIVKKACVSMISLLPGAPRLLLLDGHNNPGFSGGPVVFAPPDTNAATRVAGVVSAFRYQWENVFHGDTQTDLRYRYNTGVVVAHSIDYALEIISANPIGVPLSGVSV